MTEETKTEKDIQELIDLAFSAVVQTSVELEDDQLDALENQARADGEHHHRHAPTPTTHAPVCPGCFPSAGWPLIHAAPAGLDTDTPAHQLALRHRGRRGGTGKEHTRYVLPSGQGIPLRTVILSL